MNRRYVGLSCSASQRSEAGLLRAALAPAIARVLLAASLALLAPTSGAAESPPRRDAAGLEARAQAFWSQAQEELFADLVLTEGQRAGVDAIIADAARDRGRAIELQKFLAGEGEGDADAKQRARAELRDLRQRLQPEGRIDAMRALLSEEQRIVFDRNWRLRSDRLFAEERRGRANAPRHPGRRAGSQGDPQ